MPARDLDKKRVFFYKFLSRLIIQFIESDWLIVIYAKLF